MADTIQTTTVTPAATTTTVTPTAATTVVVPAIPAVVVPDLTQAQIQSATQPIIDDAVQAAHEVNAMLAAYKAGGLGAVAKLLPALAPEVEKDYTDIKTALPDVKVGYKTSEFWIVLGVELFVGVYTYMGKVPPVDGATVMGAVVGVYAVVRSLLKKQ